MASFDYVFVAGYGWSGSSAVVDLLKEFNGCWEPGAEFRVIKDPYGLRDLYRNLVECWNPLNSDTAIRDFLWYMEHLNHVSSKFSLEAGFGYSKCFGACFMDAVRDFISRLVDFEYKSYWWIFEFKKTKPEIFRDKALKVLKLRKPPKTKMYFSNISADEFFRYSQDFIDSLFALDAKANNAKKIILDQAIDIQDYETQTHLIRGKKMIIVDRDPRDIYADLIQDGNLIGKELSTSHDVMKYVKWHHALRTGVEKLKHNDNILYLQFEDLIFDYENIVKKIAEFIEIDIHEHTTPRLCFDPDISKKNIGIWKTHLSKEELSVLKEQLGEYFREESNEMQQ